MDRILRAIADLRINGTKEEEIAFEAFKKNALKDIKKEELEVLVALKQHHTNTLKHSVMVAQDVVYLATQMGLSQDKILSLKIAALLHDVGKLDIHEVILDLGDYKEMVAIWEHKHPGKPMPKGNPTTAITIEEVISYKASKSSNSKEYIRSFKFWLIKKGLISFLNKSVREYLNHHQDATRTILEKIGVSPEVVNYAAAHHLSYFNEDNRRKLPKECRIIEIADKFNAIIQSEGVRHYVTKKTRTKALDIILFELNREFKGSFHRFERNTLAILAKRHLPIEIQKEIIPHAEKIILRLQTHLNSPNVGSQKETEDLIASIAATLALSKELGNVLDNAMTADLENLERELKEGLEKRGLKAA
jgi:putative nucleotidyltransferase with HDIG domain